MSTTPKKSPKNKRKVKTPLKAEVDDLNKRILGDKCFAIEKQVNPGVSKRPQPLKIFMNSEDVKLNELQAGDFVFVLAGDKKALGICWPSPLPQIEQIQVSQILYENLKLNDECEHVVKVERFTGRVDELERIFLDPQETNNDPDFSSFIKEALIDIEFVIHGQVIEIYHLFRFWKLTVNLENEDDLVVGRIVKSTKKLLRKKPDKSLISFDSIGGLKEQIMAIKEMVQTPLLHPERFTKFKLSPPKGLLLYGPPGTGKTLCARAVAAETNAHFISVNGPEIVSKYYGDTEEKLKLIFEDAEANAPSIIFLDEIDALCPSREDSQSELEKKIVSCLLTLMDGADIDDFTKRPRIFVIGATNRPNAIDSALRRPGRFDREFEIGIPNLNSREEILKVILKSTKNSLSENEVNQIAAKAHGYVGADLAAIVREAGIETIKRLKKNGRSFADLKLIQSTDNLVIGIEDMIAGMAIVKPSVVREILIEVPKVYWNDIGGQEDIKQKLKEAVEWPLKNPEIFLKFNIRPPKGILLYGKLLC